MRTFVPHFAIVIAVLVTGCSDTPPPTTGGSHIPKVDPEAEWLVVKVGDWRPMSKNMWLTFYGSPVSFVDGRADCNVFIGEISKFTDTEIEFESVLMSAALCSEDRMRIDEQLADALRSTRFYKKRDGWMEFFDTQHNSTILFHAVNQLPGAN